MQTGSSPMSRATLQVSRLAIPLVGLLAIIAVTAAFWPRLHESDAPGRLGVGTAAIHAGDAAESGTIAALETGPFLLTKQQQRGKEIYLTGISPSGSEMTAVLGNSHTEVPAAMLTCVNCHRHDGRGKPEGGIDPSNIRWDELTKPYGFSGPRGRTRPPYDESLLRRSISMGLDAGGTSLDDAMPRYRMTHQDLDDLAAYLMVMGRELDPGLSAERIRIGVILPPRQLFPEMNQAIRAVVSAYVSEFNRAGGVYQREIEVLFADSPTRREDRMEAAIEFVQRDQLFALTSSFIAGDEVQIARRLGQDGVPVIGAQTHFPQLAFPLNRYLFYLNSGLVGQSRTLLKYVQSDTSRSDQRQRALLLVPDDDNSGDHRGVANAIEADFARIGWQLQTRALPSRESGVADLAGDLKNQDVGLVFSLLSGSQALKLLRAADECGWFPRFYSPGSIVGPELFDAPAGFTRRLFLSFPTLPAKQAAGMAEYHQLSQLYELSEAHLATQFEALSAVNILLAGLQQVGSDLSRELLVEELETLSDFRPGFTPAVSYGPNRRVGAQGAFILTVDLADKKLVSVSDWLDSTLLTPGM